ncbi:MAG: group II intron reverse transcriptase/maturase, partial [Lachnospiraceae bacterium]|nr:group II intron reverse transcriptase/maturase [Lachnospiraceae bacterium]
VDVLDIYKKYRKPNSLAARLRAHKCELCGVYCAELEMHQVKRLKDLRGDKEWERIMLQRRRKTLAVCPSCHVEIHNSMKS